MPFKRAEAASHVVISLLKPEVALRHRLRCGRQQILSLLELVGQHEADRALDDLEILLPSLLHLPKALRKLANCNGLRIQGVRHHGAAENSSS